MWKCPVCETEYGDVTVCPKCGFDGSCDYERYPTAFTVRNAKSTRALQREWEQKQTPRVDGGNINREIVITPEQAAQGCRITAGYSGGKRVEVTIPANWKDGGLLRCAEQGYPGKNGGKNGDLILTVRVQQPEPAQQAKQTQQQAPAFNSLLMDWFMESWQGKNQTAAERCFRERAEADDPEAQLWLGVSYECGAGAARNPALAADWYRRAAIHGSTQAQKRLALLKARDCQRQARQWYERYMNEVDREKGITYLIRAAEMGCVDAQRHLGRCCELGSGVPQNADDAIKWYGKAADQGNEDARKRLAQLLSRLNRQERR